MKPTRSILHLAVPFALLAGACDVELETRPGVLAVHNLGDARRSLEYRAWVYTDGEYHWFASFTGGEDAELEVNVPMPDEDEAESVVISVDPAIADKDTPFSPLLSGRLDTFSTTSTNDLQLSGEHGLGTDFVLASATFVLDTPTTDATDDHGFGVWWHDPTGTEPALNLPELPQGWTYEGWVETAAGRAAPDGSPTAAETAMGRARVPRVRCARPGLHRPAGFAAGGDDRHHRRAGAQRRRGTVLSRAVRAEEHRRRAPARGELDVQDRLAAPPVRDPRAHGMTARAQTVFHVGGFLNGWVHLLTHTRVRPRSRYYAWVRRNHHLHHFKEHRRWFAFTGPWLDGLSRRS